jgi:hypothetical protein
MDMHPRFYSPRRGLYRSLLEIKVAMKTNLVLFSLVLMTACSSPRTNFMPVPDQEASDAAAGQEVVPPEGPVVAPMKCGKASDCESGFCSGGFCCNSACSGSCQSCALPEKEGTCSPQTSGANCGGTLAKDGGAVEVDAGPIVIIPDPSVMAPMKCGKSTDCKSGFCSEGFCCNSACSGSCQTCALPGKEGTCSPRPSGAVCGPKTCTAGAAMASSCDGNGGCASLPAQPCAPFICGPAACDTSCTNNTDCIPDFVCLSKQCVGKRPMVVSVSPPQGFLSANSVFTVTFTKKMDPSSTVAAVSFSPTLVVDASWDATGKILTLRPTAPLAPLPANLSPDLMLSIAVSAKDATGLALESSSTFNYKRLRKVNPLRTA